MNKILTFIVSRLKERSTWIGLTTLLSAVGVGIAPEEMELIITAGVSIGALIQIFVKDPVPLPITPEKK